MTQARSVYAVLVAFRPDTERLARVFAALGPQVSKILVVDNGGERHRLEELLQTVRAPSDVIPLRRNLGLATAQNRGIQRALAEGARYVLLLDQDSVPGDDMVARLIAASEATSAGGHQIAAAGPVLEDERSSAKPYFVRIGMLRIKRVYCGDQRAVAIPVDMLISSGMLIGTEVLRNVGGMEDGFFIDHVDTEWCLRARSRGYRLIGVCDARLSHRLGDKSLRVIGSRRFLLHTPVRYYYIFRNSMALYSRGYPGLRWKLTDGVRLLAMFVALFLYGDPRVRSIRAALRGIADGVRGRAGRAPESVV